MNITTEMEKVRVIFVEKELREVYGAQYSKLAVQKMDVMEQNIRNYEKAYEEGLEVWDNLSDRTKLEWVSVQEWKTLEHTYQIVPVSGTFEDWWMQGTPIRMEDAEDLHTQNVTRNMGILKLINDNLHLLQFSFPLSPHAVVSQPRAVKRSLLHKALQTIFEDQELQEKVESMENPKLHIYADGTWKVEDES